MQTGFHIITGSYCRKCILLLLLLSSSLIFAQKVKKVTRQNLPPYLEGVWASESVDSVFGHKTQTELSFSKDYNWTYIVKVDGNLIGKDFGSFIVVNDSLLTFKHGNKIISKLPLIALTSDTLKVSLDKKVVSSLYRKK